MLSRRTVLVTLAFGLFALVVTVGSAVTQDKPAKIKTLVVTGFDVGSHRWRETTELTRKTLEESGRFDVKVCEDIGI